MPLRQPLRSSSQLRASSSDSEPLRSRPLTDRSPKLVGDRRSPRGAQSDPITQKKLGSRIADLESQLGLAQQELKCLKHQLASNESAKKSAQEKPEKKTRKPTVSKREEIIPKDFPPSDNHESNEKENRPASEVLDDSHQETDVFEVPVEKVAVEPNVEASEDTDEDEVKSRVLNPSVESSPVTPEPQKPSFEEELALKNDEITSLKAKLEEKEKELINFGQENESLKQQLNEKTMEASSAKAKGEEAALQLNQVKEELETTRDNAARFNEQLEASEKAKEALETEMKKLRIQTEQWRKAADAAATVLSGGMEMNGRRMSERCGSMEKYSSSVFEPGVGGYGSYMGYPSFLDDSEDVSDSGKKKADIAIGADFFIAIAGGVRRAGVFLVRQGRGEEFDGLGFEAGYEFSGNAMVDHLKESEFLAGFDEVVFGVGVGQVDQWDAHARGKCAAAFARLHHGELFNCGLRQDHHACSLRNSRKK
nr:interactor of constitutive active ROPs 1-like [Ipomoea batatas]